MIDFTNKIVSEETILRNLVSAACRKAGSGIDPDECAKVASEEIVTGILIPTIRCLEDHVDLNNERRNQFIQVSSNQCYSTGVHEALAKQGDVTYKRIADFNEGDEIVLRSLKRVRHLGKKYEISGDYIVMTVLKTMPTGLLLLLPSPDMKSRNERAQKNRGEDWKYKNECQGEDWKVVLTDDPVHSLYMCLRRGRS